MTLMKEEYEDFMKKIDHAERILDIIKIRELLTPFRRLRENSPRKQAFDKSHFSGSSDGGYFNKNVTLPMK